MQKYAIMRPGLYKNSFNVAKTHLDFNKLMLSLDLSQLSPEKGLDEKSIQL